MTKTRHLDRAIAMLRPPRSVRNLPMRAEYELALARQGWRCVDNNAQSCEFSKPGTSKRMMVFNGDRVSISFNGVTWKQLNQHARRNILIGGQRED